MSKDQGQASRQAEHWKKKYYDSLDDLEEKEKAWREIETLLRQLTTRLTLVADVDDPAFDKQLEKLRNSIRDSRDLILLKPLIQDISAYIAKHDGLEKSTERQNPALPLQQLLDEITIPKELQRQHKHVRKKLLKVANISDVPELVKDFAELLSLLTETIVKQRLLQAQKQQKEQPGLLSGLFGKKEQDTAEAQAPAPEQPQYPPQDEAVKQAEPVKELVIDKQVTGTVVTEDASITLAGDILIQLLERLNLPDDLSAESEIIRNKLDPCQNADTLAWGLDAIAKLLSDMNSRIQNEKQDLENFLKQLTERLHELDTDIQETARLRDSSLEEGQQMSGAVNQEVAGIQKSVDEAVELDALKTAVQSRVIIIRNHVDRFLENEENRYGESDKLVERLTKKLKQTEQQVDGLKQQVADAHKQAMTDNLSGLPNRLAYENFINDELARFNRYQSPFVLMVWDVDKFKSINDTYGHAAGDKVLRIIAGQLQKNVRETDLVARYGGEEFVALLPETELEAAKKVAEKLRQAIEETEFHFRKKRVVITASCGLAEVKQGDNAISLFERADSALYLAKQNGRNRFEIA